MTNSAGNLDLCPVCRKGHRVAAGRVRVFEPHGKRVEVMLQTSDCDVCGETTTKASQHTHNLRALAERKAHYGNLLMGEEILALRRRYGLTQQQASAIFGKGKIAFSRYESETSYPDESTTLLLTLAMERPDVVKRLADKAGVELPLWGERYEDEQRVKLRPIQEARPLSMRRDSMRVSLPSLRGAPGVHGTREAIRRVSASVLMTACNDGAEWPDSLESVAS
jgi:HTH-type transcriptional regulator/antitoxin MqsA